jgi:hypothetical protein
MGMPRHARRSAGANELAAASGAGVRSRTGDEGRGPREQAGREKPFYKSTHFFSELLDLFYNFFYSLMCSCCMLQQDFSTYFKILISFSNREYFLLIEVCTSRCYQMYFSTLYISIFTLTGGWREFRPHPIPNSCSPRMIVLGKL